MPAPSNIYDRDVDFTTLALQNADFAKQLKPNGQLDFSDPESLRQLTKALLHRDFGLSIELPDDRLCPPIPNRFNYILFVQRLLGTSQSDFSDGYRPDQKIVGLDIGTGASAIYPLLACRQNPSWLFLASEIDPTSRMFAERNIETNKLGDRIKLLDLESDDARSTDAALIPLKALASITKVDILLTNPPFYASQEEMLALASQKSRPPNSACTGAPIEMITEGGEIGFVAKLIQESFARDCRLKFRWFSSMLGKSSSVQVLVQQLKDVNCDNYAVAEFVQGQKTRRWCIAWSWHDLRPHSEVARGTDALEKKLLPFPTQYSFHVDSTGIHEATQLIDDEISKLELQWRWRDDLNTGVGHSSEGDVWSRHARRRKRNLATTTKSLSLDATSTQGQGFPNAGNETMFAFKVEVTGESAADTKLGSRVSVRWLQGHDSKIFESFCGWLKRKAMPQVVLH